MTLARVRVDELMDQPGIEESRHLAALAGLRRLNQVSQISSLLFAQIKHRIARHRMVYRNDRPLRVLDVASGSGDLPIDWLLRAKRRNLSLQVTALDRSDVALEAASKAAHEAGVELGTVQRDCLQSGLPVGFDVVTCSLFMHHLDPPDVSNLVHEMWRAASQSIVICDLERSRANLALVAASSRLLSRSDIVHHDAAASVRAAYTRGEFAVLLHHALGYSVRVKSMFPCRFLAVVEQDTHAEQATELAGALAGATS